MSKYQNEEEVFDEIHRNARRLGVYGRGLQGYKDFVDGVLAQSKLDYPFMRDVTFKKFALHRGAKMSAQYGQVDQGPAPTSQDFWNAAYTYDPHVYSTPANRELVKILKSNRLGPVTIGKLWGQTTLRLLPNSTWSLLTTMLSHVAQLSGTRMVIRPRTCYACNV